eukprot:2336424-Pyramimonas_sp.AAC.2
MTCVLGAILRRVLQGDIIPHNRKASGVRCRRESLACWATSSATACARAGKTPEARHQNLLPSLSERQGAWRVRESSESIRGEFGEILREFGESSGGLDTDTVGVSDLTVKTLLRPYYNTPFRSRNSTRNPLCP